jgi:BlaI family transcriptional regulator, penicillinase repressor
MARPRSPRLTDGEARLMNVLWSLGQATVGEVVEALPGRPAASYSTVQTLLRILEDKRYLVHEKVGRAFVYRPIVERRQAQRKALSHLLGRLFNDSPSELVMNVLEDERLDPAELRRLKKLIEKA